MNTFKLFVALCTFELNYFSIFYIFEHSTDKHKHCCVVFMTYVTPFHVINLSRQNDKYMC